jgi:hypothetical protein
MLLYVYFPPSIKHQLTISQSEYAAILAKRVAEAKTARADLRKRRASSMRK